ncbi:uncharacterized protein LOC112568586 isoform X2 [Pomacea canaliculata]|uniref:uncharacterized protein LOC112568586 isoform X2 n=1 Tax=Pomacea canaliculata TaxID=400727 RepID=UPI000D725AF4|nr:uncharacterized protein LOC112568586 isoform X2 [Pomacea canaliculata]
MTPEYKARDRARKGRSERERKCVESLFAMMVAQLPGTSLRGHILLLLLSLVLVIDGARTGMSVRDFRSHASIQEVECRGEGLPSEVKLWSLTIFSLPERTVLAYVNPLSDQCVTMTHFSSCTVDTSDTRNSVLRILVADLEEEETRQYGCNATGLTAIGHSHALSWTVWVRRRKTTTTTAATTTTSTTTSSVSASKNDGRSPIASSVHSELPGFYLPPYVLIIGLVLIVLLALLSLILIILQCRRSGRRRRRNRAANRESLLSTKSEMASCSGPKDLDLGVTTYRATRSFPSFSAAPQPQTVAGVQPGPAAAAFAMRYQKGPPDDTGYVSGSSNHYSEPYGCHDDSTQERVRPVSRTTIPQAKGSPQPPRLPDNHP